MPWDVMYLLRERINPTRIFSTLPFLKTSSFGGIILSWIIRRAFINIDLT
jgi:hypothetical protein